MPIREGTVGPLKAIPASPMPRTIQTARRFEGEKEPEEGAPETIRKLYICLSPKGTRREVNLGVSRDPYAGNYQVQNDGGPTGLEWTFDGATVVKDFPCTIAAYPSPDMCCVVVATYGPSNVSFTTSPRAECRRHGTASPSAASALCAAQTTEFLDAWWYERTSPSQPPPWWAFWRKQALPEKETRMKLLIGWVGDPCQSFEALDFDPETSALGECRFRRAVTCASSRMSPARKFSRTSCPHQGRRWPGATLSKARTDNWSTPTARNQGRSELLATNGATISSTTEPQAPQKGYCSKG